MKRVRNENGFTLVEVLVAMLVTALMLTAVYQTVRSATTAREKLAVENAQHHTARIMTERIGRELQSIHFVAGDERTRLTGGDRELLAFTSTASTPLSGEPGLPARIVYEAEIDRESEETRYRLTRTENSVLATDEGRAYKLADDLGEIEIRFLKNGSWSRRWDTQTGGELPEAIELAFRSGDEETGIDFRTTWPLGDL